MKAVVVVALVLFSAACRATDHCAESAAPCGGSPVGRWTLETSCQDPISPSPLQRTYLGQPVAQAGQRPPEPTTSDWCADLKYIASGIQTLNLPRDASEVVGALVTYGEDHTYSAFVTSSATTSVEFSNYCLTRFGYFNNCSEFSAAFAAYAAVLGGVKDTKCEDSANQGCRCSYTIEADAAGTNLNGVWSTQGSLLTHYAASDVLPSKVDYCASGSGLMLWGHDRTGIMDLAGVRTMTLRRIECGNGVAEPGESCEPPNTATCNAQCQII
jgi:hypothetical protein